MLQITLQEMVVNFTIWKYVDLSWDGCVNHGPMRSHWSLACKTFIHIEDAILCVVDQHQMVHTTSHARLPIDTAQPVHVDRTRHQYDA